MLRLKTFLIVEDIGLVEVVEAVEDVDVLAVVVGSATMRQT